GGGDVAQQSRAVVGPHPDRHGIDIRRLAAPADLENAPWMLGLEAQQAATILAVDGDAATGGDETADFIPRQRAATPGDPGQQVAHAVDIETRVSVAGGAGPPFDQGDIVAVPHDLGVGRANDLLDIDITGADRGIQAVGAFLVEFFREHVEIDILHPQLAKIPVEHGLAGGDVLVLILLAKPLLHLGAGAGGVQITGGGGEPVAARGFLLAGDDLDLIRGVQNGAKGRDPAVDLATPATVADLGVDTVGKIQRRRYRRQVHHVALRGKDVDAVRGALVLEQVLDILVTDFVVPFQHLAQPGDLGFVALGGGYRVAALVLPVGADAEFRLLVHLEGADLDFDDAVARPDHRGVQRAIAVFLGGSDVVVELVGNVAAVAVDDAEQGVAISHGGHQYPRRADIVDLGETDVLALHLSPDAVDMLGAPRYVPDDANPIQLRLQGIHQFLDVMLPVGSPLRQQLGDALVLHRLQVAKGEVLQLPLEVADTEAMGEGGVDVEDFPGDPQLALLGRGLDAANGAGALGQLDQRHPHVVDDGYQHLTHLGGLALGVEAEHLPLGIVAQGRDHRHAQHAADQFSNLAAKVLFHPLD